MKEGGGPAFPRGNTPSEADGMTLRDWFAGMALKVANDYLSYSEPSDLAKQAYAIADAMLEEK